jgi:hypothetical protein
MRLTFCQRAVPPKTGEPSQADWAAEWGSPWPAAQAKAIGATVDIKADAANNQRAGGREAFGACGNQRLRKRFGISQRRSASFSPAEGAIDHRNSSFPTKRVPLQLIILC